MTTERAAEARMIFLFDRGPRAVNCAKGWQGRDPEERLCGEISREWTAPTRRTSAPTLVWDLIESTRQKTRAARSLAHLFEQSIEAVKAVNAEARSMRRDFV
jgi:hypothetical protein